VNSSAVNSRVQRSRPASATVRSREQGSGSVLAVGLVAALACTGVGVLEVTRAVATAHTARSAADLAALAAAGVLVRGGSAGEAGARAARFAAANAATLVGCAANSDGTAFISVTAVSGGPWAHTARSSARAGPG